MAQREPVRAGFPHAGSLGLTVYGCGPDEARLFDELAPRFGVVATVADEAVTEANCNLAAGNRCVSISHKARIEDAVLLALRHIGVEYISTRSIGFNHINVTYAESIGISVENISYSPDSVADYTLMLMLMIVRDAKSTISRVQSHDYRLNEVRGRELRDLTVGVIGAGRIGRAVLDRLRGFGCSVLVHDALGATGVDCAPLHVVLQRSDIVTLHAPLTEDTHHLLDRRRLEQMRHGAIVVNTGRGALLDTEALVTALECGRLGGAALDVLEGEEGIFYSDRRETPIGNALLLRLQQLPNVLITPHTAYYTDHALRDSVERTLVNCTRSEERRRG